MHFILDSYPSSNRQRLLLHEIYANWHSFGGAFCSPDNTKTEMKKQTDKAKEKWKPNLQSWLHVMHAFKWRFKIPKRRCSTYVRFICKILTGSELPQPRIKCFRRWSSKYANHVSIQNSQFKECETMHNKEVHLFSKNIKARTTFLRTIENIETSLFGVPNCTNEWNDIIIQLHGECQQRFSQQMPASEYWKN